VSTDDPTLSFITPRVAAGVLFTDNQDRVLMVVPSYKDYLDIPGGYVEHGETPYQAARREVLEELGIEPPIGRLLVADWWEESPEANGGAKLLLIFDGGCISENDVYSINLDQDELTAFAFHRPDEVENVTILRLANRIDQALSARQHGTIRYLENGSTAFPDPTERSSAP